MPESQPKLFLSYARADDEPFVKRFYEKLVAEGFEVWWDRECMPSRALTFLKEIRDAIRASDRVVVVIGPKCVASDYCRAEWQAALAETKVVNPILRIGEHTLLPPELSSLHCPDLSDDAKFDDAFREVLRVLREPIPPLGALMGCVPDVPPHFQPRPDALSRLAELLLVDEKKPVILTGPQRVTVLHAMGGAGKSVLAAAFGRSTSTRRSFADGIYWLNADNDATPLALTTGLGRLLGDLPQTHTDLASSTSQLAESLAERSALVVVDNAWHVEQVEPLIDALGPSCRLLTTTRNAELATATGANSIELPELSPEGALQHLADWAGTEPEALPEEATEVARECGYLPFALALNGAMHQKGVSWADLADALRSAEIDYAEQRFKGYPYPTVLKSIHVSMEALDKEDGGAGTRLREVTAFRGSDGIPEAAVGVLWAHTAGHTSRQVGKTLAQLAGKSLIRLEGKPESRRVFIHDLQLDYLRRVTDATALRTSLLAAYEQACGGHWSSVADDGYIHYHLVEHLLEADRAEAVQALLNESTPDGHNAWFEANRGIDNVIGYLADLERTRGVSDADGAAIRNALMRTSVENMLARIPAQLYVALIGEGKTTGSKALESARRLDDPEERVSATLELIPELTDSERHEALAECLTTVRTRGVQVQARFLPMIAAHFDGPERSGLVQESLDAARSIDTAAYRAECLGGILPLLEGILLTDVSEEAASALKESVMSTSFRDAARGVLPHMPELATGLLDELRSVDEPFLKAIAFEAVAPYLPETRRADAAREGIGYFETSGSNGLWIVISLARHIPDVDLDGLIQRAATQDARQVPALIDALPEMLSGDELERALEAIATAANDFEEPNRTETRIKLLPHHSSGRRSDEVDLILGEIPSLPYDSWRRDAYLDLIDHAERDQLSEIEKQLAYLEDARFVLQGAAGMAIYGEEALRAELFNEVTELPPSREKFIALVSLAEVSQDTQHSRVVEAAFELADAVRDWELVSQPAMAFSRHLAPDRRAYMLERAFQAALRFGGFLSEREFVKLAPALTESAREAGFRFLLEDAERLSQNRQQYWADGPRVTDNAFAVAETLARIAPHLPEALISEALAMARRVESDRWRWAAICHLLHRLEDPESRTTRQIVIEGAANDAFFIDGDELQRFSTGACLALSHAIPALGSPDRDVLQNRLRGLLHSLESGWIPGLLDDVAQVLRQEDLEELAERALSKPNQFAALAASKVVPEPRRWALRFAALEEIPFGKSQDRVWDDLLADLVAALLEAPDEQRARAWQLACGRLRGDRAAVALHLAALAPLAVSLQQQATLGAAARSLLDVCRWWP